ncbi:carbohydrate ABC transporter permease [Anaerocolumna sp.]|uniref:carbohydrate ABC transporter permease n=1 Tax=Anaerocolumna sp. TaxID=2041569 RepID=UPI0028A7C9CE|nr:sugar ABC transporter permease [Anaerocolumna sp.]
MKVRKKSFSTKCSFTSAWKKGSIIVRLSSVIFGLGCFIRKQFVKGFMLLFSEIIILLFMIKEGMIHLKKLITLGDVEQYKIWNEAKSIYEYVDGDRSLTILLYGIITLAILLCAFNLLRISVINAYKAEEYVKNNKKPPSFRDEVRELFDGKLHKTLLFLPVSGVLIFTILPLIFMMSMAFTNYSVENSKLVLFDWVGLKNFKNMINFGSSLGRTFWSVLGWTIVWAILATFSNYFIGMILAMFINWKEIRAKKFWRFCFVLTVAIPHFVTLLILRQMLQPEGAINILLRSMGILEARESLPFFTNTTWARITVILINIWVGVPYTLLQVTGILQNIPSELYDSAKVDGAGPAMIFRKITLPYMLFVTTPFLITVFAGNVNNFNVIFLTSQGYPRAVESIAGKTDLLITWLYKLTIENQYFDVGAVIGIMTFISLGIASLVSFRLSGSYKNEEGFR